MSSRSSRVARGLARAATLDDRKWPVVLPRSTTELGGDSSATYGPLSECCLQRPEHLGQYRLQVVARGEPWFPHSIRLKNRVIRVRRDWYEAWLA